MEHLVVSLETAKKLKAAGFPQKTALLWAHPTRANVEWHVSQYAGLHRGQTIAAPTAQEIADQLPAAIKDADLLMSVVKQESGSHWASYEKSAGGDYSFFADTMAEALAQLWLKLQEVK